MEKFDSVYKNEKEWLRIINDTYTIEFIDYNNGLYNLKIYDHNTGFYHDPKKFMHCTTGGKKGFIAVNLTSDDVQKLCIAIKNHDYEN